MINTRSSFGTNYKSPMRPNNLDYFINTFRNSIIYISNLQIDGIPIFKHRRSTFAIGFIINMHSMINLARDLFSKIDPLCYFLPYKCSQDHIELFFSCVKARGGWNNNPDCLEFIWILQKLFFTNSVTASVNANCIDDDTAIPAILKCNNKAKASSKTFDFIDPKHVEQIFETMNIIDISFIHQNVLFYVSGYIAKIFVK